MITVKNREYFLIELRKVVYRPCIGVEIGVLRGDFTEMIFHFIEPTHFILVDPFRKNGVMYGEGVGYLPTAYSTDEDYEFVCKRFADKKMFHIIRQYSYDAVKCFTKRTMDFIYIDASHKYEDIKRDLEDWRPIVTKTGYICGHDYIDHPEFGVKQAVDEFCAEHNFEMIIFNENGGDYALRAIQ